MIRSLFSLSFWSYQAFRAGYIFDGCATVLRLGIFIGGVLASTQVWADGRNVGPIAVDESLPAEQVQKLQQDWQTLTQLHFAQPDPEFLRITHLHDASSASLVGWIEDRVHYIVSEGLDIDAHTVTLRSYVDYPVEPSPVDEIPDSTPDSNSPRGQHIFTVMSNISAALYDFGASVGDLKALRVPGWNDIAILSPRVGILQVGEGLFSKKLAALKGLADGSPVRLEFRLATLFHEAHHGDGHGLSRGFTHAVCPSGDYQGFDACDRNLNGPYSLQAAFDRSFLKACDQCTVQEREVLKALALDHASRVIKMTITTTDDDRNQQTIPILEDFLKGCQASVQAHTTPAASCSDYDRYAKELQERKEGTFPGIGTPSINWDDAPEPESAQ